MRSPPQFVGAGAAGAAVPLEGVVELSGGGVPARAGFVDPPIGKFEGSPAGAVAGVGVRLGAAGSARGAAGVVPPAIEVSVKPVVGGALAAGELAKLGNEFQTFEAPVPIEPRVPLIASPIS